MPDPREVAEILERTERYLVRELLPFWMERSPDPQYGGFLTYLDGSGRPTGETTKTFLMQIRMLYTFSSAHRAGYGEGRCAELAHEGAGFILDHYWDAEHEGWIWIADRAGRPTLTGKVGYGQCFGLYAFSEYALATGDPRGREAAERTYRAISSHMADTARGGYYEIMQPNWQPERPGRFGGDRKSLDVHMHMMEALTTWYELTGHPTHRRRLEESILLILSRMLEPESGTGYMQFTLDWRPLPAIPLDVAWGSDKPPEDGVARPLRYTSYGHNAELAWLLLHAADVLGEERGQYADVVERIMRRVVRYGMDPEYGGVAIEGPMDAPPTQWDKQFWQQAEVMVALLDACLLFQDDVYWEAFARTWAFVQERMANHSAGGEWRALVARDGTPIWDYLGHAWKISYHTVRSTIQCIRRLRALQSA